jgi:type II secretory pathway pseudopilin PulG
MKRMKDESKCRLPNDECRIACISFGNRHSAFGVPLRPAFTLIEMLTTVAMLIIVLGLMVSLARYVRDRSAQELTRGLLRQLDSLMSQYADHYKDLKPAARLPKVEPLIPANTPAADELAMARTARMNNEQIIKALRNDYRMHRTDPASPQDPLEKLPISIYDRGTLRDAWGSPIVFMPGQHNLIGLAPSRSGEDQAFFFSAGPDRKYLTREDNLYSYDEPELIR